jgi:HEAT repeat protein
LLGAKGARAGEGAAPAAPDPYNVLVEILGSGQPPLEAYAAESFLDINRAPPRDELLKLADGRDPRVRMTALAVLGATRRPEYVQLYRRGLRDDDAVARLAAAFGLAMAGDASMVTQIRDALSSPDIVQRRTACWLLGLMGNPSAEGLLKIKLADPDAVVVLRAAEALGRLGSDLGLEPVRRLTEHPSHPIRAMATRLLGRIGGVPDVPRLERLCESKKFLDVKFAAIGALARLGDFKRVGLLVDMLDAPADEERALAARTLGDTAYAPALPALAKLLEAKDPALRMSAAAAMLKIQSAPEPWRERGLKEEPKTAPPGGL